MHSRSRGCGATRAEDICLKSPGACIWLPSDVLLSTNKHPAFNPRTEKCRAPTCCAFTSRYIHLDLPNGYCRLFKQLLSHAHHSPTAHKPIVSQCSHLFPRPQHWPSWLRSPLPQLSAVSPTRASPDKVLPTSFPRHTVGSKPNAMEMCENNHLQPASTPACSQMRPKLASQAQRQLVKSPLQPKPPLSTHTTQVPPSLSL